MPVYLDVDLSFNRQARKFNPLRGIIKIYDVLEDGNEIISCVGTFETDDILNGSSNIKTLECTVGRTSLKM